MAARRLLRLAQLVAVGAQTACTDAARDRNSAVPSDPPSSGGGSSGASAAGSPGAAGAAPSGHASQHASSYALAFGVIATASLWSHHEAVSALDTWCASQPWTIDEG